MKKKVETDKQYGELLVLEEVKHDGKHKGTRYNCKCSCGKEHSVLASHLRQGKITHCGCKKKVGDFHSQWKGVGEISGDFWWSHVVRSANGSKLNNRERKPKELSITIEDAWNLFLKQNRKCALSEIELKFPKKWKDKDWTASLDRIDSSKGYTIDNVQWVHKHINIMKNKFENIYFIEMCKKIAEKAL